MLAVWVGITLSYLFSDIPPSFAIMTTATVLYALAVAISVVAARVPRPWRPSRPRADGGAGSTAPAHPGPVGA